MQLLQTLLFHHKLRFFLIFLGCSALLGTGYILQYRIGLIPCPLCILQRFFFALIGLIALIIAMHKQPTEYGIKAYSSMMMLFSVLGGTIAARQIWIQHNPPSLLGASCLPGLESMTTIITSVFHATADCAEQGWTLLNLSIPEWSLISFIILAIVSSIPFWKRS